MTATEEKKMAEKAAEPEQKKMEPPPEVYTTKRGREFHFGKPGLKHRAIITKVLRVMSEEHADYDAIIACAKARGITVEEFTELSEEEYTEEEQRKILINSSTKDNVEFAAKANEIITEVLFATVKKAPFPFETIHQFEEKMDDYGEALELTVIGMRWVSASVEDLKSVDRPN